MLFIGNIILRNVSLDYFEEGVDPYSATGKPICLLGDVNTNTLRAQTCNFAHRAMPFFRQLINRKECTIIQQHLYIVSNHDLWAIFLQITSAIVSGGDWL